MSARPRPGSRLANRRQPQISFFICPPHQLLPNINYYPAAIFSPRDNLRIRIIHRKIRFVIYTPFRILGSESFRGSLPNFLPTLSSKLRFPFRPPTQETTTLAVKECVTPGSYLSSNRSNVLRRISLNGRMTHRSLDAGGYGPSGQRHCSWSSIDRVRVI